MSKAEKNVKMLTPSQILALRKSEVTLNSKKAMNEGVARVITVHMSTSLAPQTDRETGEIRPMDRINGIEIPRIIFEIDLCMQNTRENGDGTFTTGDECDAAGNVVVRATQKTVGLSNIRQLRKLYGLSAPFDGTLYNVLYHEGEFYTEDPIADVDVATITESLSEGMKILSLTESQFYYVRYVGRASQALPLEDHSYSFVRREGGITWFTEDSSVAVLQATV